MNNHSTALVVPGWYPEFVGAVIRQLPRDIDQAVADGWIRNQEALKKTLREALMSTTNIYPVLVDYGMSVKHAVRLGRYDWANSDITSCNFPTKRKGTAEVAVELIHFDRYISTDEALRKLDKMGYRPAELHELLAFGEKYPDVQREFPIIALGSVWRYPDGGRGVPYLSGGGSERGLGLGWVEGGWGGVCRFAAVRK